MPVGSCTAQWTPVKGVACRTGLPQGDRLAVNRSLVPGTPARWARTTMTSSFRGVTSPDGSVLSAELAELEGSSRDGGGS